MGQPSHAASLAEHRSNVHLLHDDELEEMLHEILRSGGSMARSMALLEEFERRKGLSAHQSLAEESERIEKRESK